MAHNPRAAVPLPEDAFPGIVHHELTDSPRCEVDSAAIPRLPIADGDRRVGVNLQRERAGSAGPMPNWQGSGDFGHEPRVPQVHGLVRTGRSRRG